MSFVNRFTPEQTTRSWLLKVMDVPQYDALLAAAEEFQYDEKLHLRTLCNDSSRCAGLNAVQLSQHPSAPPTTIRPGSIQRSNSGGSHGSIYNHSSPTNASPLDAAGVRKVILDYSRQQVTGETMDLLFDLADAVGFLDRREAFRMGERINITEELPALHHVLRMPKQYDFANPGVGLSSSNSVNGSFGGISASGGGQNLFESNHTKNSTSFGSLSDASSQVPTPSSFQSHAASGGSAAVFSPSIDSFYPEDDGPVLNAVHRVRAKIDDFARDVRSGDYVGITGEPFANTLVVGCGGMHLGPKFVHEALQADCDAAQAAEGRTLRFLSNVDPVECYEATKDLDPAKTIVIVMDKDFDPGETMLIARSVREWLVKHLATVSAAAPASPLKKPPSENAESSEISDAQVVAKHMVAVSVSPLKCQAFGILKENVFAIWHWVVGRFSVCSAVGLLPLTLQYSPEIMDDMLQGAHNMDEHFFHAPLRDNLPVLLGLLGVWNSTFMGHSARAVLPYAQSLQSFCAYVQHVEMESNGKRVALDGVPLGHPSSEVNFGAPGTNSHHSFFQLMHQGQVVPADFIGFMESQRNINLPGEAVSSHDEYMSNFFAQPDALAYGKTLADLRQEGVPDGLREHMVFTGNRPSLSILFTRLDAYSIGQLLALYEHRAATQGFMWGINSFDQYGIELGKQMAKHVRSQLSASRRTGASVQGFNLSTSSLLDAYLAHGKPGE